MIEGHRLLVRMGGENGGVDHVHLWSRIESGPRRGSPLLLCGLASILRPRSLALGHVDDNVSHDAAADGPGTQMRAAVGILAL